MRKLLIVTQVICYQSYTSKMLSVIDFGNITQDYRIRRVDVLGMVGAKVQVWSTMGKRRVVQVWSVVFVFFDCGCETY